MLPAVHVFAPNADGTLPVRIMRFLTVSLTVGLQFKSAASNAP